MRWIFSVEENLFQDSVMHHSLCFLFSLTFAYKAQLHILNGRYDQERQVCNWSMPSLYMICKDSWWRVRYMHNGTMPPTHVLLSSDGGAVASASCHLWGISFPSLICSAICIFLLFPPLLWIFSSFLCQMRKW